MLGSISRKLLSADRRLRRHARREFTQQLKRGVDLATVKTRELDKRKPRSCVTELIPDFPELDRADFIAWRASVQSLVCDMYKHDAASTMLEKLEDDTGNDVIAFRAVIALLKRLIHDPQVDQMRAEFRQASG